MTAGGGEAFRSQRLPPNMRRSPKVTEVLSVLYLGGLSTGDFAPALGEFPGSEAGLSASTSQHLTVAWQVKHAGASGTSGLDYVYWSVVGVYFNLRLEDDRLRCLVIVVLRNNGTKELVAVADGYRESSDSWAEVLRDLRDRGLGAPVLAVGDGRWDSGPRFATCSLTPVSNAAGCTKPPTSSTHRPSGSTPTYRSPWRRLYGRDLGLRPRYGKDLRVGIRRLAEQATAKSPTSSRPSSASMTSRSNITCNLPLANPIESTFATLRLRQRVTKGAGSRAAGLGWSYTLLDAVQQRWRRANAAPPRRTGAGATFVDGQHKIRNSDKPGAVAA